MPDWKKLARPLLTEELNQVPRIVLHDDVRSHVRSCWERPCDDLDAACFEEGDGLIEIRDDHTGFGYPVDSRLLFLTHRLRVLNELDDEVVPFQGGEREPALAGDRHRGFQPQFLSVPLRAGVDVRNDERKECAECGRRLGRLVNSLAEGCRAKRQDECEADDFQERLQLMR
jgi:hypothetical protein